MKYHAIIHLLVILLGILFLFSGVSSVISNLYVFILAMAQNSGNYPGIEANLIFLVSALASLAIGYSLILNSKEVSKWIGGKSGLTDGLKIVSNPRELLSIFILFLALGHLLDYLPAFTGHIFVAVKNQFVEKIDSNPLPITAEYDWITNFIHLILASLMIIFCKTITAYFSKYFLSDKQFIIEQKAENE